MRLPPILNRLCSGTNDRDPLSPLARPSTQPVATMPVRTASPDDSLAQYLAQRARDNRAVSPSSRRVLERATEAVEAVRKQIPMRGNVTTDLAQTERQAAYRLHAVRFSVSANVRERLNTSNMQSPRGLRQTVLTAASARIVGAGNCNEFQSAVLLEAGKRLQPGERLVAMETDARDHTFVQMESKRRDGTTRVVVLDAWANGPAVLAEDCAYAQHAPKPRASQVANRDDARRADRIAATLVKQHNQDEASLKQLKASIEGRAQRDIPSGILFEEQHVTRRLPPRPDETPES